MTDLRLADYEVQGDGWLVSTARRRLDLDAIQRLLAAEYWTPDISRAEVERNLEHCLPFGLYDTERRLSSRPLESAAWKGGAPIQIGFARVITDYWTFAYLSDVVIDPDLRGRGLGKAFMAALVAHPALQGLRRFVLITHDAHRLYEQVGFGALAHPGRYMEIARTYQPPASQTSEA